MPNDLWYINQLNQKNLLHINKNRTARWVAARTGAAGSHNAPLTKQSFSKLSIPDEMNLSKKKENPGFYQSVVDVPYAHKKRALDWVKAIQRHKVPGRFTLQDSFFNSIPTNTDLVKARAYNEGGYQSAWHGTPHDFDGFDLGAIGTGEGAQVHGWGLYFAQNRGCLRSIRDG